MVRGGMSGAKFEKCPSTMGHDNQRKLVEVDYVEGYRLLCKLSIVLWFVFQRSAKFSNVPQNKAISHP
jgi:hypothetical protein